MSGVLGTLVVRIAAEMRQYKADMDTAASVSTDTAKKIEKANADVEKSHEKLIGSAGAMGAAVGLAAVAAAAGLGVMVKGAIDNADAVGKMSAKTGIATETLSAYQLAASLSDVSNETLAQGMKALSKNISEGSEVLTRMGVSTKDSNGNLRSLDAVMADVADKFAGYKDGAGKAADAQLAFGRAGMNMIPMLNGGSAGLAAMRKEAEELGLVIDGPTAAAAEAFNDNVTRLGARTKGFAASLAAQVLPALTAVTESFMEGGKNSGFMTSAVSVLANGLKGLISVGYGVAAVFEQVGTYFGGIAAAAAAMLRGDFGQVKTIFGDLSKDLSDKAVASGARINQVWSAIGDGAVKVAKVLDKTDPLGKVGKAAKAATTELERMAAAGEKLAAGLLAQESGLAGDFAQKWAQLNAAREAGGISLEVLVQAQAKLLAQQPAMVAALKAEQQARDALNKAMEDYARASEAGVATSIAAAVQAEAELAQFGMLKSAVQALTLAHLEQSRELAALAGEDVSNIEKRIDAQKRLIAATQGIEAKEIARESAKEAQSAWATSAKQINQSLSDALMNAFMAGKGFGKTFVDSIKSMFNTMVLKPVISAIVGSVTGSMGLSGAANAATGGGSLMGSAGNLLGLAGAGSAFGGAASSGFSMLMGGGGMEALSGAAAMIGNASGLSSMAAGLGQLAGVLGPIALGIGAVYMLAKSLDHSGTPHTGGGAMYSASGGLQTQGLANGWSGGGAYLTDFGGFKVSGDATAMESGLVQSIVGILDSTATAFGKQAGYTAAAAFADDSDKQSGAWGALVIEQMGQKIAEWGVWKNGPGGETFSDGAAGSAEYLARVSKDVRTALDGIGLPGWATTMLDGLGAAPSLEQLASTVQQITATHLALERMGKTLVGFAGMSEAAVSKLMAASGGIGALTTNAGAYYDNFYTEGEKQAATMAAIADAFAAVNVPMPATREAFRTLVEDLQGVADSNPYAAQALATVLSMSASFASVVPAAEVAVAATETVAETLVDTAAEIQTLEAALSGLRNPVREINDIARSIFDLQNTGSSLQVDLLAAQGDTAGARALQRALDTAGFTAAEIALYDYNQALRDQIEAVNAAAQAAVAASNAELAAAQAAQAASDQAAQAAQRAADDAARAAAEISRAAEAQAAAIAQERAGLDGRLLQALGDTAALRERELAALDPSNRALQQAAYHLADVQESLNALASEADASAGRIAALQQSIAGWAATMAQAGQLLNRISVAGGGADNTESALWASLSSGTLADQMQTAQTLLGMVTAGITADTQAAQQALTTGAQAAQQAIEAANAEQLAGANAQLEAAQKMADLGKQLRDYVQGLRVGALSTLTPAEKLAQARGAYERSLAGARTGDAASMSSLQGNASAYLELARSFDPAAYTEVFGTVTSTLDGFGGSLMSTGQQQAAAASAQLSTLQTIAAYASAQSEAQTVGTVISAQNAEKLALLNEAVSGVLAQAALQKAADEARLTAETAHAREVELAQSAAQALMVQAQTEARDSLAALPGVMTANTTALVSAVAALQAEVSRLRADNATLTALTIATAERVGVQTVTGVSAAVSVAVNTATGAPVLAV